MITSEQIIERISEAIKKSELTQKEIAKRIGISQGAMSQYKTGKRMPPVDIFGALCKILDLDANEILCINEWGKSR